MEEEKVEIPQLLQFSEKTEISKEDIDRLPPKLRLLVDPLYYAECAIVELERQMQMKLSKKKRNRIHHRIKAWEEAKKVIMEQANAKKEDANSQENTEV